MEVGAGGGKRTCCTVAAGCFSGNDSRDEILSLRCPQSIKEIKFPTYCATRNKYSFPTHMTAKLQQLEMSSEVEIAALGLLLCTPPSRRPQIEGGSPSSSSSTDERARRSRRKRRGGQRASQSGAGGEGGGKRKIAPSFLQGTRKEKRNPPPPPSLPLSLSFHSI